MAVGGLVTLRRIILSSAALKALARLLRNVILGPANLNFDDHLQMHLPLTDWQQGLSSPKLALKWVEAYVAYGRPAQALEFIQAANKKFPENRELQLARKMVESLKEDEIAARNGPTLILTLFVMAFSFFACGFALFGAYQAPFPVNAKFVVLLLFFLFSLFGVSRHAIARWRLRARYK